MKRTIFFLIVILQFAYTFSQSFSNLGFDYWQAKQYPLMWQNPAVKVVPDSITKLSGVYSLKAIRVRSEVEKDKSPYGLVFQNVQTAFRSSELTDGKIDVSVQIKKQSLDTAMHVGTFVQIIDGVYPQNNNIVFGNEVTSNEWAESSASIEFKELASTSQIFMGVIIMGCGAVNIDDFQVRLNCQSAEETSPRLTDLTEAEKQWLNKNLIPISEQWTLDNEKFGSKVQNARIVGVGDNVHGSASVFKLKSIVTQSLVAHQGFTLLAIEDSPETGNLINRYIQGKSDSFRQYDMNVMYDNSDFENLAKWLREYNKTALKKVRVFGVDVNGRYTTMIKTLDKNTSGRYSSQLDSIWSLFNSQIDKQKAKTGLTLFSDAQKKYVSESIGEIKNQILLMEKDEEWKELLCYYADNLLQHLTFNYWVREKQMADNISRLSFCYPEDKIVYLAHNSHVSCRNKDMKNTGVWLKESYQDKYYIIGTCYFDGTDLFKNAALARSSNPINEALPGSYENLFNQIRENRFYLDFASLQSGGEKSNAWLTKPMLMRSYGVEAFNYYYEFDIVDLVHEYDGILFIKRSVPLSSPSADYW